MADSTAIKLTGRRLEPVLPALLRSASRAVGQSDDPFLPSGYLRPRASFDVGPAARGVGDGAAETVHAAAGDDEVLVLELADGSTFITSAEKLKASLQQSRPDLIGADGEVLFEKLRAEGAAARGFVGDAAAAVVGGLVSKVHAVLVGKAGDAIVVAAKAKLGGALEQVSGLGVTWAGTRALMWAIESRLKQAPGLYRWVGASGEAPDLEPALPALLAQAAAQQAPMLVFLHGTGSNSLGSFGDLRTTERNLWSTLERRFAGGIFAFEHRTLSESPIENALALARALPEQACISLVSHSRGGLVADLMCLADFDALINDYRADLPGTGDADPQEAARVAAELEDAHKEQRALLRELAAELRAKRFVVQRYVRVASPAQGTLLASGNFDLFLSGLLTLIGQVPVFFGSPIYSAFKRVVIEIAKNRTNAHLVPGIEAMLPDAPMARLLRGAPVREGIGMAVIAGDIQGGNLLKRLGVLLTDFLLFDNVDNDLVVDTASMLAGIAPQAGARALFDRGAEVSHFRYFTNADTRTAVRDWLAFDPSRPDPQAQLGVFQPLPGQFVDLDTFEASAPADARRSRRGADTLPDLPVVVVLPGVMGSHLRVGADDRVWFDPADIALGGLAKIAWGAPGVEAEKLFGMFYGKLCEHLARSHRVEPFAYDWRQPLDVLGERLGEFLARILKTTDQPVRLLAHSMGGLVVRAVIHKRRSVMDALMQRDGARFVMLGTPNQGAYSMVENLLGKGHTLRTLVRLDVRHDMQEVLDIVAGFRGALQLLPKPGFEDKFQGQPGGGEPGHRFELAQTWWDFKPKVVDPWFGPGKVGTPDQATLDSATWLWSQDGLARPALPADYEKKSSYVFGVAKNTPCGIREEDGRLKMVGTTCGDGTVSWESGRIGGVGSHYYLPAPHGDLPSTAEYFPALAELLATGATGGLMTSPPATRAIEQPLPSTYDAGPPTMDGGEALARGLMGGVPRVQIEARPKRRLEVLVKAMDLRFLAQPIMVGHYQQDPIAGPQRLIDRELLDGDLSERHTLGLYAGPRGTATVVLRVPNEQERQRGSLTGAVVAGLGPYDGALNVPDLTEAVRTGVLRYLLQVVDVLGKGERELPLSTLLLGYNSSANLSVGASVEALIRGVLEANAKFYETTRLPIRVARLQIVELYLDTAITAVYEMRQLTAKLAGVADRLGSTLVGSPELQQDEGVRQRLFDNRNASYWPRLIVTDADAQDEAAGFARDPAPAGLPSTVIGNRLRFLYVGARARAEAVVQQRQPGLIEALVRQQIHNPVWNEDIGRMLFQLMVPHEFKGPARQLDRVVLVVDAYTANLPWEMMLADGPTGGSGADDRLPLALRAAVVRQLASSHFRTQVRQGIEHNALVVGNPSVEGFGKAFPDPLTGAAVDPSPLDGAEVEAEAIAAVLGGMGYAVTSAIGADQSASDVLAKLYRQPYRVLHIAAHGVFDALHADGQRRSGVVLSDGLLITAAEVEAMETVPELVFLNCCHLGKVDRTVRDGNKLAASVARELIQIGVRCVVVAGWAVDDAQARLFGESFYRHLLQRRKAFGDAVFEARQAAWEANREDITWGAFQAYGDPSWRAEARGDPAPSSESASPYVSPEELLDELARTRADLLRRKDRQTLREIDGHVFELDQLLKNRCPQAWRNLPALHSALGATWRDLGRFEQARESFLAAVQAQDKAGRVPIKDIEQLANVEARLGERTRDEALIRRALKRLDQLELLVAAQDDGADAFAAPAHVERAGLRGSAWKRLASLHARRVLERDIGADDLRIAGETMREALKQAVAAYRSAEGIPGQRGFDAYPMLNRLAIDALTPWSDPGEREAAALLAQQCAKEVSLRFRDDANFYNAVMQPEALLVARLIDGSFGKTGDAGTAIFDTVAASYREALSNITAKPRDLDSMLGQMCLTSRFHDALSVVIRADDARGAAEHRRIADRLIALANLLQPGSCQRDDRPPNRAPSAADPAPEIPTPTAARKRPARTRAAAAKAAPPATAAPAQDAVKVSATARSPTTRRRKKR
ncbi:MAG: CHAT domain-containing protein [Burkholderiaceae bacterium]